MLLKSYIRGFIKNSTLLLALLCGLSTYAQIKKDSPKKEKDSISLDKVNTLPEVVVQAKTLARKIKEGPVAVEVLELEPILSKTGSLLDVMIRVPGVNARSDGAIGDPVNFAINGLDKKSIVLFKDGIPMSFYGHSFEPGHVSASMFERIEVYKGVLPIGLGADALGGGINFITRKPKYKSLDVSAETGSFNTQRYTLNTYMPIKNGLYAGANVSYVQSDNNWYVDVGSVDPTGNVIYDGTVKARLKNNGVNMYSGEYFVGIQDKKWAEDVRITFINSWLYKRINHFIGDRFASAADALYAYADDKTLSGVISYKNKFFRDKLKTDIIAGYGKTHVIAKDTANVGTDRFGNIVYVRDVPYEQSGELYGMDLSLDYMLKSFRGNASYEVLPNQSLQVNHTYTAFDRIGTDPIGGRALSKHPDNYNEIIDIYTYPSIFQKSVSAVGWEGHFLDNKLESVLAYKHYRMRVNGYTTHKKPGEISKSKLYANSSKHDGWVAGLSYRPNTNWTFKTSYEHTLRMPDEFELFGNSQGIRTNFDIVPERGKNFNIEAQYRNNKAGKGAFMIGTNLFYRRTRDIIYLQPDIPFSYFTNALIGIYARGLDLDIYYQPFKFLTVGGNGMYMDRRFITETGETSEERSAYLSPLIGNLNLTFHYDDWLQKGSRLELYWYWNYTHRYSIYPFHGQKGGIFDSIDDVGYINNGVYENWVPHDGSLGQSFMTQGITYTLANPKLSISLECRNVTDEVIYNNWRNQGPGRSYSVKLRWQIDFDKK